MDSYMSNIFFKSLAHRTRLLEAMRSIDKEFDPEYGAAIYVLSADFSTWERAQDYVSSSGICFDEMLSEHWSSSYQVLIKWAGNLFNNEQHIDPVDLMWLDESSFLLALGALHIRRYGIDLPQR
jgi:hypothetical protein